METISRDWEALAVFHQVACLGSFTVAAETLGTSKSNLSKQIQRLEASLGYPLFARTTRKLSLTEPGRTLFIYSQKIFALSEEAGLKLKALENGEAGTIRITAPLSVGNAFLPEMIAQMRKLLPGIRFDADLSNDARDFAKDEIDFAVRAMEVTEPELIARDLGRLRDAVVCTPALAKRLNLNHPRELSSQECILSSTVDQWNTWNLISEKEAVQVQVTGKIATTQYLTAKEFALRGFGIARLPTHVLEAELKQRLLVDLFPEFQVSTHPLFLVYTKNRLKTQSHRVVRDWILDWFKGKPEFFTQFK